MFKLIDELFALFGYWVAGVLTIVGLTVGFAFYPTVTAIILGLLVIAPFMPWLEKGLIRLNHALDKQLAFQSPFSLKTWGNELKQAFKKGMNSIK